MQRKFPVQEINMARIEGPSLDSETKSVYTVNGDISHLENPISNENVRPTVQTCHVHGCKVVLCFSSSADPDLRQEVGRMLLSAFQRRYAKE